MQVVVLLYFEGRGKVIPSVLTVINHQLEIVNVFPECAADDPILYTNFLSHRLSNHDFQVLYFRVLL